MIIFLITTVILNTFFFILHKNIANYFNVFDYPDKVRKFHKGNTPITGGLLVFLNLINYSFFYILNDQINSDIRYIFLDEKDFFIFLLTSFFIFILGILDDKFSIGPNKKFLFLLLIIIPSIYYSDQLLIENVRFSFVNKVLNLNSFSFFWTLLCFLLFINALNMFDGINLQVSIYSKILCFSLIILNGFENIFISILASLIVFSILNFKSKSFLGDGGTYLLAYIFGYSFIKLYNSNLNIYSDQIVLIMLLPGLELMRLFIIRIKNQKNPFSADRNHLHHYLSKKYDFLNQTLITQSILFIPFILSLLLGFTNYLIIIVLVLYSFMIRKLS